MKTTMEGTDQLIHSYKAGEISRREFFQRLAFLLGSVALAYQFMIEEGFASEWEIYSWPDPQGLTPQQSIEAGEKRLPASVKAEWVKYPSEEFEIISYVARPATGTTFPAIIVIHENRGLTEFVIDIAQRWATEGLVAIAVDFLSRVGGTGKFETMDAARRGIGQLTRPGVVADLHATMKYLKSRGDVRHDKIGVSGFCWGGGHSFNFAVESREVAFAMPFYGSPPAVDRVDAIGCPIYGVFAESDARINQNLDPVAARMKELGKNFSYKIYPGTQHAFMNFTNEGRYNAEQAKIAWADVVAFVKQQVS